MTDRHMWFGDKVTGSRICRPLEFSLFVFEDCLGASVLFGFPVCVICSLRKEFLSFPVLDEAGLNKSPTVAML